MELSTREDIDAPIDWVWARVTDDVAFERIALRRGAEVQRQDKGSGFIEGASWVMSFRYRGRDRQLEAKVDRVDGPSTWSVTTLSGGIDGVTKLELVAMSKTRTRIILETRLSARTLSARLLLQSLKLAKSGVLKRFRDRVAAFADDLEKRYRDGT